MLDLNEWGQVELPLLNQLRAIKWKVIRSENFPTDPKAQLRSSFTEIFLHDILREKLKELNHGPNGKPWLDDTRINSAISQLEKLGAHKLEEANQAATKLLLEGMSVDGIPDWDGGRDQTIQLINWQEWEKNSFIAINQFRVDRPGANLKIIPDVVLFVNGIPLVVIECKSQVRPAPIEEAVDQIKRYANQRSDDGVPEGIEKLFYYNQLTVVSCGDDARLGTISSEVEHYRAWKTTHPLLESKIQEESGRKNLRSQEILSGGVLRPERLLDICRNFVLEQTISGRKVKIVARYQQYRAVLKSIERLANGKSALANKGVDTRGGLVWHTQGSGKSLTMVFLVRKLRQIDGLKKFKVVIVTDRKDLEDQLASTAALTNETVRRADSIEKLQSILREPGKDLVFGTIQKYQERDSEDTDDELPGHKSGKVSASDFDVPEFPELNESESILVLIDEAHRSQASVLHANLIKALPNCARIGFTGTPIFQKDKKRTEQIFGPIFDRYTIRQSEEDKATVPIRYVPRELQLAVQDGVSLEDKIRELFADRSKEELAAIISKYANKRNVLEALDLIEAKAEDMLRHYVLTVLPNAMKAQVVAFSREGAIRYLRAFERAKERLLKEIETGQWQRHPYSDKFVKDLPNELYVGFHQTAKPYAARLRDLEFRCIISGSTNDPRDWKSFTDSTQQKADREKFTLPFEHKEPEKRSSIGILIVKSMLLTGFDAPVEQALYIDRTLKDQELLQAIARVNRTHTPEKTCGYVVDYAANFANLKSALKMYSGEELEDARNQTKAFDTEEIPKLRDRCERLKVVFTTRGLKKIETGDEIEEAIFLLKAEIVRHEFVLRFRDFLESMENVLPRPEAIPFQRDVKLFGYIQKVAARRYRDGGFDLTGVGAKVKRLIDEHLIAEGFIQRLDPIPITDPSFLDKLQRDSRSSRARASEMEHAIRQHIRVKFNQDPVFYRSIVEKLEAILTELADKWDQLEQALKPIVREASEGPKADDTGLDPIRQAPFLKVIVESRGGNLNDRDIAQAVETVIEMVSHISQEIQMVDFWRKPEAQNQLRKKVIREFLNQNLPSGEELVPYGANGSAQQQVADLIMEMARSKHDDLISGGIIHE